MRLINPNLYLSLIFCLILFISGRQLAELPCGGNTRRTIVLLLFFIAIPALLFPLGYFDFFGESPRYCSYRAINRIEILTSLIAPLLGYITFGKQRSRISERGFLSALAKKLRPFAFPFCLLFVLSCYIKPVIRPLSKELVFQDRWEDDVMMQSASSTCGPSALATAMYATDGRKVLEEDIVKAVYTSGGGTDNWYLARYARESGYKAAYSSFKEITDVKTTSVVGVALKVAGVKVSDAARIGHYIAILNVEDSVIDVGDPLKGRLTLTPDEFNYLYEFTGFAMSVSETGK